MLPNNIRFGGFTISDEKIIEADGKIFFTGKSKTIESGIGIINFTNNNMTVEFYEIKWVRYTLMHSSIFHTQIAVWIDYTSVNWYKQVSSYIGEK